MASSYPTSLDSFSTAHADNVGEAIHASTINDLADAVNKIERRLGTTVFNAKGTYGAVGDGGTTNDAPAIQAAIDACIAAGGGTVYLPAGSYRINSALDFSAIKGTDKGMSFIGDGSGNIFSPPASPIGTTFIRNHNTGPAIKAYGHMQTGVGSSTIVGLNFGHFMVKNMVGIGAAAYTIDVDYLGNGGWWRDIYLDGSNGTGNGFRTTNTANGAMLMEVLLCRYFNQGTGHRMDAAVTNADGSGRDSDFAFNCGNAVINACQAYDCKYGFTVGGSNLINSITMISCKAVQGDGGAIVGSIGFDLQGNAMEHVLVCPHTEGHNTGIQSASEGHTIINPLTSFPTTVGTKDASSAGIRFLTGSMGNVVIGHRASQLHYGVSFEGTSSGNEVSSWDNPGAPSATALFGGVAQGNNDYVDLSAGARLRYDALGSWNLRSKAATQNKTANTTLANDDTMSFAVAASTKYRIRGRIFFDTVAAADFKYGFSIPTSPALVRIKRVHAAAGVAPAEVILDVANVTTASLVGTGTTGGYLEFEYDFHNGANSGTWAFQWAQDTSDAGTTSVLAGSYVEYSIA